MNKQKRAVLQRALVLLASLRDLVEDVCRGEQFDMENLPENLQGGERYEKMETAVDSLEDALDAINEIKEHIETAMV